MIRRALPFALTLFMLSCGSPPQKQTPIEKAAPASVKITQFYAPQPLVPKGMHGQLCYGVEGAKSVDIDPPVEKLWPAVSRCFEISPKGKTTYTLTARGENGSSDTKSVLVSVGGAAPRLYDLSVNATQVKPGEKVTICFKVANAKTVTGAPGKLDRRLNCLIDNPKQTTTYKITALGADEMEDSGEVTVAVK